MCKEMEELMNIGIAIGENKGRAEGRVEGRVEGRAEGTEKTISGLAEELKAIGVTDEMIKTAIMNFQSKSEIQ